MKKCSSCKMLKSLAEFSSNKSHKDGKHHQCKKCKSVYDKKYRESHEEIVRAYAKEYSVKNADKANSRAKEYYTNNKAKIKKYLSDNADKINAYRRIYYSKNKEKVAFYMKSKYHTNANFKLRQNIRTRIRLAIKKQTGAKNERTHELLGCTISQLIKHLESQFYPNPKTNEPMTWNNHGLKGWHIDHIKPCASFDLTDPKQQKQCFNYTNLQPLWWFDNFSKGVH